jgi:7-carboxy-7-deazaguanine synthase
MSLEDIVAEVKKHSTQFVCLTGGEPLGQRSSIPLMEILVREGYTVSLETNGSFSINAVPLDVVKVIDLKCPDSGESDSIAWENLALVKPHDQFKFVIASKSDFDWAQDVCKQHRLFEKCALLFSPAYGKISPTDLAKWILAAEVPLTMQLQMHKEIWGPNERGV